MPLALYTLALAVFAMGTSEFMLAGLLPAIAGDLEVTLGAAGLLTSAFALGMVVGAPLMAAFARRWPPRTTLLLCLLVFAGCHVLAALTSSFSLLLLARVLSAFANAGFLAVALSTAAALVPAERTGRAVAILLSGTTIATVAGVPAGAVLGAAAGWRTTFWAIALLCIPAALGILGSVRQPVDDSPGRPSLVTEIGRLRSPRLLLMMTLGALVNGGTFAVFTYLAPVVTETAELAGTWVPVVLVVFGIGSFLGVSLAGRLADAHSAAVLGIGGPLLLAGWIALALLASSPPLLIALTLLQGTMSFGVGSTVIALVLRAAVGAPTMGGSYATAALNIGAVIGPVLGGLGLGAWSDALAPMWVAAGLMALALVVMLLARPRRDEPSTAVL